MAWDLVLMLQQVSPHCTPMHAGHLHRVTNLGYTDPSFLQPLHLCKVHAVDSNALLSNFRTLLPNERTRKVQRYTANLAFEYDS
jgi:hypothetical protein